MDIIRPSGAYKILGCPGSAQAEAALPKPPSSSYANEGSHAHDAAASYLTNTLGLIPTYACLPKDDDMAEYIRVYTDYVEAAALLSDEVRIEAKIDMDWLAPGMSGTVDCAALDRVSSLLVVLDLKYGKGVQVYAEENPQLMLYALGILGSDNPEGFDHVNFGIIQPRVSDPIRAWNCSVSYLYKWAEEVWRPAVKEALGPNPKLNPGEKQCKFCSAIVTCPAIKTQVQEIAKVDFAKPVIDLPPPSDLTPLEIRKVLDFSKIIIAWQREIFTYARDMLESGRLTSTELGWKLVPKRGRRQWSDEEQVQKALSEYDIWEHNLKSPAQMERVRGITKKMVEPLCETVSSGTTIAPLSDNRQELPVSAQVDFLDTK